MKGLAIHTEEIFEPISKLDSIKEYVLIGGTALSLQLGHRFSEDLDFCKWKKANKDKEEVAWYSIEKELNNIGNVQSKDIIDFNQANFILDGVKLSFYANNLSKQPSNSTIISFKNNIRLMDIKTIGIMKIEVMLRRSTFRDYYDLYSILRENINLSELVEGALKYSGHHLKTKDILAMLSNGERFTKDNEFENLDPKYKITASQIQDYMIDEIKKYNNDLVK
ncbi:MAG: nucleotidyl transferase AbiEii/AbiGii toxin family protein [Bacteroidales bacterium]|jgi:predicted nucleotidyltransferase component of viral defense system|nr:nucleotidyl transferase AbiEii/AbiGii toxin family protein [Bacteroidales bacterium]